LANASVRYRQFAGLRHKEENMNTVFGVKDEALALMGTTESTDRPGRRQGKGDVEVFVA
jgi:hypothetical protein